MGEKKKVALIHYIIVLILAFGFRFLPPFAGITELGMGVLGAFLGAIYGWVFIDLAWPSFIAITATGLSCGMASVITGCFGNETFLCAFVEAPSAVELFEKERNLDRRNVEQRTFSTGGKVFDFTV